MKVIIAGGRTYALSRIDYALLDGLHRQYAFMEVVHGDQAGADRCGKAWAAQRGIPCRAFPADWKMHGRAAGPLRNSAMVAYVGAGGLLVAFQGHRGTADIVKKAVRAGLDVIWYKEKEPRHE